MLFVSESKIFKAHVGFWKKGLGVSESLGFYVACVAGGLVGVERREQAVKPREEGRLIAARFRGSRFIRSSTYIGYIRRY